jgi:hypothetical protein
MLTDPAKRVIYSFQFVGLLYSGSAESRRGCRVAEGPALEKRYPVESRIVGSNPTLSATKFNVVRLQEFSLLKKPRFYSLL